MKYFTTENLTTAQIQQLQLIDKQWIRRETDSNWEFISKSQIKQQKGFDNCMWEHIKDKIPVMKIIT